VRRHPTRRTGRSARWLWKLAFPTPQSAECGWRSACSRTAARHSICRAIRCSSTRCAILSGFICPHQTRAVVLSVDEMSEIQALDREQPVLPMMPGVPERHTHSYVRHGTTTLFAALDVALGFIIGKCYKRPPGGRVLEVSQRDRRANSRRARRPYRHGQLRHPKTPKIKAWLARRLVRGATSGR
jgi:hypothetical protein